MGYNYKQGIYEPKNWDKYVGTKAPRFLSSFEYTVWKFFDENPYILEWGAEVVVVPYYNPIKERKARYIVDAYVKYQNSKGETVRELLEIKPKAQTKKPRKTAKKNNKTYLKESKDWIVNNAKWEAAERYAKERGMVFRKITEDDIFI